MTDLGPPDEWTAQCVSLPLSFAQVREDPRLDMELASALPNGATVVMIASGGDTAVCLGRLPLYALHLVDMNPAQLALARLKWHLARDCSPDTAAALLGHLPIPARLRRERLLHWFAKLSLPDSAFGALDFVSEHGPDHSGRYERTFAQLRHEMAPCADQLRELLDSENPVLASRLVAPENPLGECLDAAFARVMCLPNLVALFGTEATQNPRMPFAEHFASRTRLVLDRLPARSNPFLSQIFAGTFRNGVRYDWLQASPSPNHSKGGVEPTWHTRKMTDVLGSLPAGCADLVHLSNILDWLSPMHAQATLRAAYRVLKPGARVIIRSLNSVLAIETLPSGFLWDLGLAGDMEARDRSFFYPQILVGTRP